MDPNKLRPQNREQDLLKKLKELKFDEILFKYRFPLTFLLVGLILLGFGVFFAKDGINPSTTKVEVLESATESQGQVSEIVVEVAGAVESPGVYKFTNGDRVEDALIAAGGVSADADRSWMEKFLNRAAKISDGQKIYIPKVNEQPLVKSAEDESVYQSVSSGRGSGFININTASASELESLWGIGPVYAQNIIEHRPYSSVEELLSKKIIKKNVYERNKDKLSVY